MPAKNLLRVPDKDVYLHIYNRGVEGKSIFADQEDFAVFLGFLRDYLIDPKLIEKQKKSFTVKGKTYHGTPHQPKNYYKKVELIAYSISSDHFHLVVHQKAHDVIQGFIRSICTRYSIYFNKKYQRRGSLFEGPYKSAQIPDTNLLLHLVTYLHTTHTDKTVSSSAVYLNQDALAWMSKFNFFESSEIEVLVPQKSYKEYAENYIYNDTEKQLLSGVIIANEAYQLERRILDKDLASIKEPKTETHHSHKTQKTKTPKRIPEYLALGASFVFLFAIGLRNISLNTLEAKSLTNETINRVDSSKQDLQISKQKPVSEGVLSASDSAKQVDPLSLIYSYTVIKKGSGTVLVYKDNDTTSGAITTAHDGDHFVAYPVDLDWYQVRFSDDSKGYILSKYIDIEHKTTK